MGKDSDIQWTHHTFNPHWGCVRVSPGCENCYAESFAHRLGLKVWGVQADRREFGDKHWAEPIKWNKAAEKVGERHRVFCASMADVFEDHDVALHSRMRLWGLIDQTPWLDWLLLTKRPENMVKFSPKFWRERWPSNVWAGCTVEDQKRANERIPNLLSVPAVVRFVSAEPLLERVDLIAAGGMEITGIDWVIIGGESGHGARPFKIEWARDLLDQCRRVGMFAFVKQLGAKPMVAFFDSGPGDVSLDLKDRKHGGDISEFPADLQVREFPVSR